MMPIKATVNIKVGYITQVLLAVENCSLYNSPDTGVVTLYLVCPIIRVLINKNIEAVRHDFAKTVKIINYCLVKLGL